METKGRVFGKAFNKNDNTETKGRVFGEVSDEILVKEYIQNYAKPEDIMPTLLPHLKNGITPQNSVKRVGYQMPKSQIPETNYIPQAQQDAVQRMRLKGLGLETLNDDIQNAGKEYEKIISGWQDQKTLDNAKPIIENTYNRLKAYQNYVADYGDGIDTAEISKQIKAYKEVLDGWGDLSADYGKYKSAEEYNAAIKTGKMTKEELQAALNEAERLEYEVIVAENGSHYSPSYGTNIKTAKSNLETHLKKYGIKDSEELRELIKNAETRAVTADNKKSLDQYQIEIDSLEHIIATAKELDEERQAIIRSIRFEGGSEEKTEAEWAALKKVQKYLGQFGYKTIDEARTELSKLKGERNALRTYKVGTGEYTKELTAITDPETVFYNENAEDYIKKGEQTDKYKGYINSEDYKFLIKSEKRTLAYYIAKDAETGKNEAEKFLKDLTETLNTREGEAYHKKHLKDNTFMEVLYSVPVGLDQFASGMKNLFNTEDDYIPISSTQVAGQLARSDLEEVKLPKWLGGWSLAGTTYDFLSTIANMAPSILASFVSNAIVPGSGAYVGGTLMGASAAGNAYQEALNSGMDKSQARTYSTLVGVSEAALSATLSKVMGGKALSGKVQTAIDGIESGFIRFAANYGTAFVSEGMEEGLQEILTPFFENFALGYNKNGFEDIDWGEVAYSFLLGGLSGGLFETVGSGIKRIKSVNDVAKMYNTTEKVKNLLKVGLSQPADSKVYKLSQKYNAKIESKNKISKNNLYNLVIATENLVNDRLVQLGEKNNTHVVAGAVVKKLSGIELSLSEMELLSKSSYGQEVLQTVVPKGESETEVDKAVKNEYNNKRGEEYVRTDEFRDLQAESQGMSDEDIQLYHAGSKQLDEKIRENIARIFRAQINTARNGIRNDNGLLKLESKGNSFNLCENVDGELFHDIFEIAKKYLRNGELVDLHAVETTDDGVGYNDCYNYLSEDGLSGFSITPDGDLISVFNASGKAGFLGAIAPIVKERAKTLDCYNSPNQPLRTIYEKVFGFKTVSIMDYNMDFDHDNIAENHSTPKIAFMVNTEAEVETKEFSKDEYDEAVNYRNSFIEKADTKVPANFMPENSLDEERALGSGRADGDIANFGGIDTVSRKHLSQAQQEEISAIGEKLGRKVVYEDFYSLDKFKGKKKIPDGYLAKDGTVHINYYAKRPVYFLLKHEITHYLKRSLTSYQDFMNLVFDSRAFKDWLDKKGKTLEMLKVDIMETYSEVENFDEGRCFDEILANFVGEYLFGGENAISQKFINALEPKQKKTFRDIIKSIIDYFKKKFSKNKTLQTEIEKIEKQFIGVYKEAVEVKTDEGSADIGEPYAIYNHRGNLVEVDWDSDNFSSLSQQLKNHLEEVNNMQPVDSISFKSTTGKELYTKVVDAFKKFGFKVDVQNFGTINLDKDEIDSAVKSYINTDAEAAALLSIPRVLKRGKIISGHQNHKNRNYPTITFAAPVELNGKVGNVVVAIKVTGKTRYNAHRVLMPDGTEFVLEEEKDTESQSARVTDKNEGQRSAKDSVSNNKLTQNKPIVKNNISKDGEFYSIPIKKYGFHSVDRYTEKQYNDYGWLAVNNIITEKELKQLYTQFANIKLLGHKYPKTPNGEYMVMTGDKYGTIDSIVFIKGSNKHPIITKVYKFVNLKQTERESSANEVADYEQRGYDNANEIIEAYAGYTIFSRHTLQDCLSYREHKGTGFGTAGDRNSAERSIGTRSNGKNIDVVEEISEFEPSTRDTEDYSIPSSTTDRKSILTDLANGEITVEEAERLLSSKKTLDPAEIANLNESDADTTAGERTRRKGESNGDGDSEFYGSLMESDIFDQRFKDEAKDDTFIQKYKTVTNKETLRKAAKELDEGGRFYVDHWWALTPERANLIDTAVGFILMDRYQRVGKYEQAIAAAEKVREFGTASGQQVQIFSILGRLDPNTMAAYAQDELTKAFEIMIRGKTKRWIQNNENRFYLTEEDINFIRLRTIQAAQLPEGRDKAIRLAEISARIENKLPAEKGQGIKALQRISMLLNAKTQIRNITGNGVMVPVFIASDFFGSGIDKAVSKITGTRTTGNFKPSSFKGMKKGAFETMDDFRRHINTRNAEMNRFEIGNAKSFNEQHKGKLANQLNNCAKVLNALDRFTSFCLEIGDRPFYEMWFMNSLNNQLKLNNATEATPEMIAIASNEALQRTWQDSNKVVSAVSNFRESLNQLAHIGEYGLGDVFIKFTKTPANLTKAIFDFSPAGMLKSLAVDGKNLKNAIETGRFDAKLQKKFVDNLSKGIAGTLLYVLVYAAASAGYLTGAGDDDKDVANFEKYIQGMPEYSVKIFGKWYSYDWMQPVGAVAATVTDYMKAKEKNPDNEWHENVWEAIKSGGEVLYNQSFMQSIQTLFTADSVIDGIMEGILDEPSVFVPQLLSQFANTTDDYRRVSYESDKPFQSAINRIKAKIPGLRQTLPKQIDVLGREVPNSQKSVFNAFFNPGNTFTDTSTDVTDEIYTLYTKTKDKTLMPRVAPYSITVKGITKTFTADEKNDFQRISGNAANDILKIAFKTEGYKKLSDEEKVDFINDVYDFATKKAESSFEYDYKTLSAMVGEYNNGKPILSETDYNKLPEEARELLAEEYFFSKTEIHYIDDYEGLVRYYINKVNK